MENIRIDQSEGDASEPSNQQERKSEGNREESDERSMEESFQQQRRQQEYVLNQQATIQDKQCLNFEAFSPQKTQQNHPQQTQPSPISPAQADYSDQIQSEFTYEQLSQQLQKALCKIKSNQSVKGQTFLDRVQYFQKKKHCALLQRKQQKQLETTRLTAKQTPTNAHSQRILQQYQPIQERSTKIIEQKRKKIERHQIQKRMKEEEAIEQQLKMNKNVKKPQTRSREEFFSSINSWKQQKQRKIVAMAQQQIKSEMEGVTFQPQINSHSRVMVQKIGKVPIQEREVKPKKVQIDQDCTFKPKLNKTKQ